MRGVWMLTVVLALLPATRSEAMQMEVTPSQLCGISDAVVIGDVVDIETAWAAGGSGGVERHVQIAVTDVARGSQQRSVSVLLPGGTIGQLHHFVEDVPELKFGQRYMLFLDQTEAGWQIIGGDAGAVPITTPQSWVGVSRETALSSLGGCHE